MPLRDSGVLILNIGNHTAIRVAAECVGRPSRLRRIPARTPASVTCGWRNSGRRVRAHHNQGNTKLAAIMVPPNSNTEVRLSLNVPLERCSPTILVGKGMNEITNSMATLATRMA